MKIGFLGTQSGMTLWQQEQLAMLLKHHQCLEFVHGDEIGAAMQAVEIAFNADIKIYTVMPPFHDHKRAYWLNPKKVDMHLANGYIDGPNEIKVKWLVPEKYHKRNENLIDSTQLFIAAPKEYKFTVRSGTWTAIKYAWKLKKDVTVIPPIERPDSSSDIHESKVVG